MILSFWFAKGAFGYLIQSQSTRLLGPPFTSNNLSFRAKRGIRCLPATPRTLGPPSTSNNLSFRAKRGIRCLPATPRTLGRPSSNNLSFRAKRGIRCLPATPRTLGRPLKQFVIPSKARNPLFAGDGTDARPAAPQTTCHSEQSEESAVRQRHERLPLHLVQTLAPLNRQLRSSPPPVFNNLAPPNPPFRRLTPRFPRSLPSAWLSRSSTIRSLC